MEKACWDITVDWMKNTGFRNDTGLGEYIGTGEETAKRLDKGFCYCESICKKYK